MNKIRFATLLTLIGFLIFPKASKAENMDALDYLTSPLQWCYRLCPEPEFDNSFLDLLRPLDHDDFDTRDAARKQIEEILYRKIVAIRHAPLCEARKVNSALEKLKRENPKLGSAELWRGLEEASANAQIRLADVSARNWKFSPDAGVFFELTKGGATAEDAECESNWILARSGCVAEEVNCKGRAFQVLDEAPGSTWDCSATSSNCQPCTDRQNGLLFECECRADYYEPITVTTETFVPVSPGYSATTRTLCRLNNGSSISEHTTIGSTSANPLASEKLDPLILNDRISDHQSSRN